MPSRRTSRPHTAATKYSIRSGGESFDIEYEAETSDGQSLTNFAWRNVMISAGAAIGFWVLVMLVSSLATDAWHWSLAAILGLALLPLAVSGGLRRRT